MYPFQTVFFEVAVRVNAEDVTATHREHPVVTPLPRTVPPVYKTRHPFQLSIQPRQTQRSVSFIGVVLRHSLITDPL
jgi:hypothetical protein